MTPQPASEASRNASAAVFHQHEIAVVGYSGSGKTTLCERMVEHFAGQPAKYRVGYVKHSGHKPAIGEGGKDTARVRDAGAQVVTFLGPRVAFSIENIEQESSGRLDNPRTLLLRNRLQDVDFIVIEGMKYSKIPKVVVVDAGGEVLREVSSGRIDNVVALVIRDDLVNASAIRRQAEELASTLNVSRGTPESIVEVSVFSASQIEQIAAFTVRYFKKRSNAMPVFGLVLSGGRSTRMGEDKGEIRYHGEAQVVHSLRLLESYCDRSFVSVRDRTERYGDVPLIEDTVRDLGPVSGILSALNMYPNVAWIVVACDMPFVSVNTIRELLHGRDPFKVATSFGDSSDGLPEPLCTVYEPSFRSRIYQFLSIGMTSPRKMLLNSHIALLPLSDEQALTNINTPAERSHAEETISRASSELDSGC